MKKKSKIGVAESFLLAMAGIIMLLCAGIGAQAQILSPAAWSFSSKKLKPGIYELHMKATIDYGWKIYSQTTPAKGPLATKFTYKPNPLVLLGGKPKEVGVLHKKHEDVFGVEVHYYQDEVDFVQVVKLKKPIATVLTGTVEFMVCDENRCLPPDKVEFKLSLK